MSYWDVSAATAMTVFTSATEVNNASVPIVEAAASFVLETSAEFSIPARFHEITVAGSFRMTAAAAIQELQEGATVATGMAPFTSTASLNAYASELPADGTYTELREASLLGAWQGAQGPGATLVLAGREARQLVVVNYADFRRLRVDARVALTGRPIAMAGTKKLPAFDDGSVPDADRHVFVLVEAAESPTAGPKLECRQLTQALPLVGEVPLAKGMSCVWAPADSADGTFIIVAGDGRVEIRSADSNMTLLASLETGVYRPAAVSARRRTELDRTKPGLVYEAWHILVFSEIGAEGALLEYTYTRYVSTIVAPSQRIAAATRFLMTAGADLQKQKLIPLTAETAMPAFISTAAVYTPFASITAATSMRSFSANNTEKNIDAIEARVSAATAFAMTTAASLEVA